MATGSEGSESASMMARMEDVGPPSNVELVDPAKLMTLTLWIALTKTQFDDLVNGKPVIPDEYSNRFGLRRTMLKAVERANLFMSWSPAGYSEEPSVADAKEYLAVQIKISPLGYMRKMEQGTLVKLKPDEYRWMGSIHGHESDENGEWLYRTIRNVYQLA